MNYESLQELLTSSQENFTKIREVLISQALENDVEKLKKQWDVEQHDVCDPTRRRDKTVYYEDPTETDANGKAKVRQRIEQVNRIPVPFQKAIVSKAVSFLFGNPVIVSAETNNKQEQNALKAILRILSDNKIDSRNREVARQLFRAREVCEIWYPVEMTERHDLYGFPTRFKLRMSIFSPWDDDSRLYPMFDEYGDMIAFSREYTMTDENAKKVTYFDTYTDEKIYRWVKKEGATGAEWTLESSKDNVMGLIPVVYATQEEAEWEDVQRAIERLEYLLSNHGDTNDYNGSPTVVVTGTVLSMGKKGEQGKLLEVDEGGKVEYLSWDHAPESVKMEIDNLFRIIYSFTQTPDISFESVKGISSISGIALKLLFMDAHLKVQDKKEIFDPYLKRRTNIIKAFLGVMDKANKKVYDDLDVYSEIKPYMIEDRKELIDILTQASGGKAVISQKTAIGEAGFVDDSDREYERIRQEESESMNFSLTEGGELGTL